MRRGSQPFNGEEVTGEGAESWRFLFTDSYECEQNWRLGKYTMHIIPGIPDEDLEIFHFQENTLITNSYEGVLKVWDLDTGEYLRTINNKSGEIVWFEFVNNILASSHLINTEVSLWDINTGELLDTVNSSKWVNALCLSNDQLICGELAHVRVWDLPTGKEASVIETLNDTNHDIWMVDNVVLCGNDINIRAYDLRSNQLIQTIQDWPTYFWFQWETQTIYTPDDSGHFHAWNVRTKEMTHTYVGHTNPVGTAHMEDGKFTTCSNDNICVWDLGNSRGGEELCFSIPTPHTIWGIATEERRMVGVNLQNDVYVWKF